MRIKTPYRVKCNLCGFVIPLDMDLECVSSYERNMGPELEYAAIFESSCPQCGEDIMIKINTWEYPEGKLNHYSVIMEGTMEIEKLQFIMHD